MTTFKVKMELKNVYLRNLTLLVCFSQVVIYVYAPMSCFLTVLQRYYIKSNPREAREEKKLYSNFRVWLEREFELGIPSEVQWVAILNYAYGKVIRSLTNFVI